MSPTRASRRRALLLVAVGGALAVVLSGCGATTTQAGAAAVVGDQQVPDSEVADQVAQVRTELGDKPFDAATVTNATVDRLTQQLLVDVAAQREGVVVTPTQIDDLLTQTAAGSSSGMAGLESTLLEQYSVPKSQVRDYAETFLQQQALATTLDPSASDGGAQALTTYMTELSDELDTRVSPRYGTWDSATLKLGPVPDDLASPAS